MAPEPPLRILQVASSLYGWGGIERYVDYLSSALVARGHDVTVACPSESPLAKHLRVPQVDIAAKGKYDPRLALPYLRLFRERSFDLIHVHFSPDFEWPAWAAKRSGVKTVMTRHIVQGWSAGKAKRYARRYDRIVGVSDAVRRVLADSGVPQERLAVAKAGVPALIPTRESATNETFTIGFFGRLDPEKGVDRLIQAAEVGGNWRVRVYGDGDAREDLARQKERTTLHALLSFEGRVEQVADAMASVDAVVIPSVWEEAFPYSALEAMSLGKPIVAFHVGGLPEIVQDGVNGLLVEKGDAKGLAQAFNRLAERPAWAAELGRSGLHRQRSEYTVERFAERMEAVYRAL